MATNQQPSVLPTNSWEGWHEDELVEELHRHREKIANRFNCNLDQMYEYYSSVPIDPKIRRSDIQPATPSSREK